MALGTTGSHTQRAARRGRHAVLALSAVLVTNVVLAFAGLTYLDAQAAFDAGPNDVTFDRLVQVDDVLGLLWACWTVATLVSAVLVIRWLREAYRATRELGATGLRYGTGWCAGAWFVPIVCLVVPKRIVDDVWRGSDPDAGLTPTATEGRAPVWLAGWWGLFLATNVLAVVSTWNTEVDEMTGLVGATTMDVVFAGVDAAAAALAIRVIGRLGARQVRRREAVGPGAWLPPLAGAA